MLSPFRLFRAGSPFGPGRGAPRRDVRRQIADIMPLVDGPAASGGGVDGSEDIFRKIRKFQSRLNLKPDGIVNPGGPTESALNAFAVANAKGGPRLAKAIEPAFADLTEQGLSFTPDPRNPEALGMWRDANGRRVAPELAGQMLRPTGPGAPDLGGKQQLFVERFVGKEGRSKVMNAGGASAPVSAESGVAAGSGGTSIDPFEGIDNPDREDRFTSGALRRTADRVVEDADNSTAQIPPNERIDPHLEIDDPDREKNFTPGSIKRAAEKIVASGDAIRENRTKNKTTPLTLDQIADERLDSRDVLEVVAQDKEKGLPGFTPDLVGRLGKETAEKMARQVIIWDRLPKSEKDQALKKLRQLRIDRTISLSEFQTIRTLHRSMLDKSTTRTPRFQSVRELKGQRSKLEAISGVLQAADAAEKISKFLKIPKKLANRNQIRALIKSAQIVVDGSIDDLDRELNKRGPGDQF